jgi:hypothetical protein
MQIHLPLEYKALVRIVESLPGQPGSLVAPFTSFALNINVCTQAHRDVGDHILCLVLAISSFTGGGLVLHEPGLSIELGHGDWAAFHSNDITHYNTHYTGSRASFVLQSDRAFERWLATDNGWSHSNYYK